MFQILLTALIIVAILMVAIILLQKSEGSGLSGSQAASMFGGALSGKAAGNFLTKLTAWLATIFFGLCMALAFLVSRQDITSGAQSQVRMELINRRAEPEPTEVVATEITEEITTEETRAEDVMEDEVAGI